MDDHARRFVDDGNILVLIEDLERDGFGLDPGRQFFRDFDWPEA